jgi:hypothetical protein
VNEIILQRISIMSSLVYSLRLRLRRVDQEKLWTYALTTILVLVIYIVVRQLTFPEPQFDVAKFAEIDFTKFQPPKPEAKENKPKEQAKVEEAPDPTKTAPAEMPQVDLTTLEDLTKMVDQTPKDLSALSRMAAATQSLTIPELNVGTVKPILNAPVIQNRPGAIAVQGTPSNVYNPDIEAKKGIGGAPGNRGYTTGRTGPITGQKAVNTKAEKVNVKNFGESDMKKDMRELFRELAKWMRNNPYDFTPALKIYMRYKPGDLTSKVAILDGTTSYDLFMLCNEASEDFGLLLATAGDSASATCLRDTGFRKQSFYLSKGIVGRNETQEVFSVNMLEEKPTKQETGRFYSIFLSWWDDNKPTAGGEK